MTDPDEARLVRVVECEVYSRVVGYYRPVSGYNLGKKQEFSERHFLKMTKVEKDPFPPGGKGEK